MGAPIWPPIPQRSERPGKPVPLLDLPRATNGPPSPTDARSGPAKPWRFSISFRPSVSTVRGLISTVRPIGVDGARGGTHGEREPDTCRPGGVADGLSGRRRPRQQDLPTGQGRRHRARRRLVQRGHRRVRGHRGAVGQRQDHAAQPHRLPRHAHRRRDPDRRRARQRALRRWARGPARAQARLRLPDLQPHPRPHRLGERRVSAADPAARRRPPRPRERGPRAGRPRRPRAPPAAGALGRPAAARGHRPRARRRAGARAGRRAHRQPRQRHRARHRRADAPPQSRARGHLRVLDPRSAHHVGRRPRAGDLRREATMKYQAIALLCFLAVLRPDHVEPQTADLVVQGRQALDADRPDDAIALFEKAVAADPKSPAALAWLGSAQVRKAARVGGMEAAGWVKRGFDTLDEAAERFPDAVVVYVVRGITAARVPDLFRKAETAVKDLGHVVALKDTQPQAVPDAVMPAVYLNLGLAYKKTGQPAAARAAWEKAKTLYPAAPEAAAIDKELRSL